jgi:hypothetical protein
MEKKSVVGWIGFLVFVLIILGIAGVVFGVSMMVRIDASSSMYPYSTVAAALFFLQATLAFGFALRSMTR